MTADLRAHVDKCHDRRKTARAWATGNAHPQLCTEGLRVWCAAPCVVDVTPYGPAETGSPAARCGP